MEGVMKYFIRRKEILQIIFCMALLLEGTLQSNAFKPSHQETSNCSINDFVCDLLATYTDDRKYSEVCWLTTHNAFANEKKGWNYAQQNLDFEEQYALGVRSFMIDLYWYTPEKHPDGVDTNSQPKPYIAMCHEPGFLNGRNCLTTRLLKNGAPESVANLLAQIKTWLDADGDEIITLQIESRFGEEGAREALFEAFDAAGLTTYLYTPQVASEEIQDWPTLGDLRNSNRRLIVFSDNINDGFIHTSTYRETKFDLGKFSQCEMREDNRDSRKRAPLFVMNHFHGISIRLNGLWKDYEKINSYSYIMQRVGICEREHNMLPNFIVMDFVEQGGMGGALQAAIDINLQQTSRFHHETNHYPLREQDLLIYDEREEL